MQRRCGTKGLIPRLLVTVLFTFSAIGAASERQPVFLGIIEPIPTDQNTELATAPFVVRVAFEWKNGLWKKLPDAAVHAEPADLMTHYPGEVVWTNTFFDQNDLAFRTHLPSHWDHYAEIGLELPEQPNQVILMRETGSFHYWTAAVSLRPLVITSGPPVKIRDPDRWQSVEPSTVQGGRLRILASEFRNAMGSISFYCGRSPHADYLNYQIFVKSLYRSSRGDELISMALTDRVASDCEQLRRDTWDVQWFYARGKSIRFLGRSLEMLAIGDFDNDGHSEMLFHKRGYDYDGYLLVYARLCKQAEFGWTYH